MTPKAQLSQPSSTTVLFLGPENSPYGKRDRIEADTNRVMPVNYVEIPMTILQHPEPIKNPQR